VAAFQESGTISSRFVIEVMVRPGVPLEKIEAEVDKELARLRDKPATADELARAKNKIETSFIEPLENVRERASLLNMYQSEVGDPGYIDEDLGRYRSATAEGVREAVVRTLLPNALVIIHDIPKPPDAGGHSKGEDKTKVHP
jgi:zinc protease